MSRNKKLVKLGMTCTLGKKCGIIHSKLQVKNAHKVCIGTHNYELFDSEKEYDDVFETFRPEYFLEIV